MTTPNVRTTNFPVPELMAEAVQKGIAGRRILLGSSAVVTNPTLPTSVRGGDTVKVPYLGALGAAETLNEGDSLTPATATPESETATVVRVGKAIEYTRWVEIASAFADPVGSLGDQLGELVANAMEDALIVAATASIPGMTYTVGGGGTLDHDATTKAKAKWGDEIDDIVLMGMHSKPWFDLMGLKDANGRPLGVESVQADGTTLRTFNGCPVFVSDRMPLSSGVYTTALLKKGSLFLYTQDGPSVDTDKDILKHSRLMAINAYFAPYRYKVLPGKTKGGVALIKHA